jgi:hypothetical protein
MKPEDIRGRLDALSAEQLLHVGLMRIPIGLAPGAVLVPIAREVLDELCGEGWSEPVRMQAHIDERTGVAELLFQREIDTEAKISALIAAGYTPESAIVAVRTGDLSLLKHAGLHTVRLRPTVYYS